MIDARRFCALDLRDAVWNCAVESPVRALLAQREPVLCEILRVTARRRVLKTSTTPPLLIKQYFPGSSLQWAQNFPRRNPGEREWRAFHAARERGLPVPQPLALGIHAGATLFVTEFIAGACTLDELLCERPEPRQKMRVLHAAALLLRRMHDAGCFQRDLHFGNLLAREDQQDYQLWLIDLQRIDVDPIRRDGKRWRDLADLHAGSAGRAAERLRFLKSYLSVRPPLRPKERQLVVRLNQIGRRRRFRLWRSRRKRCCADNWEFCAVQAGSLSGFARRSLWSAGLQALLSAPERLAANTVIVKNSRTTMVACSVIEGRKLFIKRYNYKSAGYALKNLLRSSRAKRGWRLANDCFMRGVDAAVPIAYLERRRRRVLHESFIVTAAVAGTELSDLIRRAAGDLRLKRELLDQLSRWLRRVHERGLVPRDLKGENIIASQAHGGAYRLSLIDFDGISSGPPRWRARVRNLARLARAWPPKTPLTATDRWRLVVGYLGAASRAKRRKLYRALTAQGIDG